MLPTFIFVDTKTNQKNHTNMNSHVLCKLFMEKFKISVADICMDALVWGTVTINSSRNRTQMTCSSSMLAYPIKDTMKFSSYILVLILDVVIP